MGWTLAAGIAGWAPARPASVIGAGGKAPRGCSGGLAREIWRKVEEGLKKMSGGEQPREEIRWACGESDSFFLNMIRDACSVGKAEDQSERSPPERLYFPNTNPT
jgi:hypothetical protein